MSEAKNQKNFDHVKKDLLARKLELEQELANSKKFSDDEVQGLLDGFDIFTHDGVKEFAVMVTTDKGPLLITLPFDIKGEANLDQAMNRRALTGMPTMIRKRSKRQMAALKARDGVDVDKAEFDNGQVELFDFTDQVLTAKTHDSPTRK